MERDVVSEQHSDKFYEDIGKMTDQYVPSSGSDAYFAEALGIVPGGITGAAQQRQMSAAQLDEAHRNTMADMTKVQAHVDGIVSAPNVVRTPTVEVRRDASHDVETQFSKLCDIRDRLQACAEVEQDAFVQQHIRNARESVKIALGRLMGAYCE